VRKFPVMASAVFAVLVPLALLLPAGVASASVPVPQGRLQSVQTNSFSNNVTIAGSAVDPSAPSRPTSVLVTIDGTGVGGWRAASLVGHGFDIAMTIPTGKHLICVTARRANGTTPTTGLGCFEFQAYPPATKADMVAIAKAIDPRHTITWSFTPLTAGTSGRAEPWNRTIDIASGNSVRYLRAVMLHEWSHVLQYRAFAGSDPWWNAVQAFNALLGNPADRSSYNGVEHGADCIALALGADYLGYGCPTALKTFGARIAHGVMMNARQGSIDWVKAAGSKLTVAGWALDPSHPTTAAPFQIFDNGRAVSSVRTTTVPRRDVNAATGVTGVHGFTVTVTVSAGAHRICITALNECRNITT
jgi:hypothetical protein